MGNRGLALVLVAVLVFQAVVEGKLVRKKSRSTSKPVKTRRGTEKFGERLPWEARQETYDWEFREVWPLYQRLSPKRSLCSCKQQLFMLSSCTSRARLSEVWQNS